MSQLFGLQHRGDGDFDFFLTANFWIILKPIPAIRPRCRIPAPF